MREHAEALKPVVQRLPAYMKLLWALAREPRLSRYQKGLLAIGAAYSLSPVDLVPGFIPVVGQLDDLLVLLTAIRKALDRLPPEVRDRHLAAQGLTLADLEADLAAVQAALAAAVRGAAKATGRALAWGARLAGKTLAWGARHLAGALSARRTRP
ncbi:MAG: DUF1232 domain-containing protein [Firmicutes bacterium]|nr:DUF1232 domain-containing protein [Bacillota bacterium]